MQCEVEAALLHTTSVPRRGDRARARAGDSEAATMKKYTKLVLAVVAVISSLCFVIYKYRYDRLYHVMQVLEVFGSPEEDAGSSCHAAAARTVPSWQQLEAGVWVFSAYCSTATADSAGQACSRVTAVGQLLAPSSADLQCALWFEGSVHHLPGILAVTTDNMAVATFTCESKFPDKSPHALSIYKGKAPQRRVQIQQSSPADKSLINLCILPDSITAGDTAKSLQESLIFHSFVGVSSVRLYSDSVPSSVVNTVQKLRPHTNIEMVPWTSPGTVNNTVTDHIVSQDCYYHSQNKFDFYAVLNSRQVLMPLAHKSVPESLKNLKSSKGPNKLPVKMFCSEYPTEKKAKNLEFPISILKNTWYNRQLSEEEESSLVKLGAGGGNVTGTVGEELSINEYKDCERYDFSETDKSAVYEGKAMRFSADLVTFWKKMT